MQNTEQSSFVSASDDTSSDESQRDCESHALVAAATSSTSSTDSSHDDDDDEDGNSSGCSTNSISNSYDSSQECVVQQERKEIDHHAAEVQSWTNTIPIGLGLCPWAIQSHLKRRLSYRTCLSERIDDAVEFILSEVRLLCGPKYTNYRPLSTALVICPNVPSWNCDFQIFDQFIRNFKECALPYIKNCGEDEEKESALGLLLEQVTLVSFHPEFLRWRGLPDEIQVGSVVQSPKAIGGFQKSSHTFPATLLETSNRMFGRRKIKVRFHDDGKEQYIPTEWLNYSIGGSDDVVLGPVLPDNSMHRSPYPTIHLIHNQDLGHLPIRDVSRVKRKNTQRMMKLGWNGIAKKLAIENRAGLSLTQLE